MGTLFLILAFLAAGTFGYLWYRVGWKEAVGAVVALYGSIVLAVGAFIDKF